jgi:hypothetical protein
MMLESVHYNCVCDESTSLYCANPGCRAEIEPNGNLLVTPEGTVYCSESCGQLVEAP